jgi:hypothetical protein
LFHDMKQTLKYSKIHFNFCLLSLSSVLSVTLMLFSFSGSLRYWIKKYLIDVIFLLLHWKSNRNCVFKLSIYRYMSIYTHI